MGRWSFTVHQVALPAKGRPGRKYLYRYLGRLLGEWKVRVGDPVKRGQKLGTIWWEHLPVDVNAEIDGTVVSLPVGPTTLLHATSHVVSIRKVPEEPTNEVDL